MNWDIISKRILGGKAITRDEALAAFAAPDDELLALLDAAFRIRLHYFGRGIRLHVIRNARSGHCGEDCAYCSQSIKAHTNAPEYPMQSDDAIVEGARAAHGIGAMRYCIVFSGRGPAESDLARLCGIIRKIKAETQLEICASMGLLTPEHARRLKAAGLNRFNHNLETSERHFSKICSTHSYADRKATARAVKQAGLDLCSGVLLGIGETIEDRVDVALELRELGADSIPVNFLDPRPGTSLESLTRLSAIECLKALAVFRLLLPERELRMAGGREACLGPMQALGLFAANSMFTQGYLTTPGQGYEADISLVKSAGFEISGIVDA